MNRAEQLQKLRTLAQAIREGELSRLSRASLQKAKTEQLLAAIDQGHPPGGLDPVVAAQVVDRFGLWKTNRRILLNQQLARDTVEWMAARTAAQHAFGRAEVLEKLAKQ